MRAGCETMITGIESEVRSALKTRHLGRSLEVHEELASTSTYLKERCKTEALPHGHAIIAAAQTGGRGRFGRSFFSPSGGLYLSVLLHTGDEIQNPTVRTGVAVMQACLLESGAKCQIKWVNDVCLGGKKVCGILVERIIPPHAQTPHFICGIGINLTCDFPLELKDRATNLPRGRVGTLAAEVLNQLEGWADAPFSQVLCEYKRNCLTLNQQVSAQQDGQTIFGRAVDLGENAELILEKEGGERITLNCGEATLHQGT